MSFDVFFQTCRYESNAEGEPLTAAEEQAVRSVLARACRP